MLPTFHIVLRVPCVERKSIRKRTLCCRFQTWRRLGFVRYVSLCRQPHTRDIQSGIVAPYSHSRGSGGFVSVPFPPSLRSRHLFSYLFSIRRQHIKIRRQQFKPPRYTTLPHAYLTFRAPTFRKHPRPISFNTTDNQDTPRT